jgi:hypothetical protein
MPPAGFEPAIPGSKRLLTDPLDRAATGIGIRVLDIKNLYLKIGFR